jgi:ArsR family transcriptional regulator
MERLDKLFKALGDPVRLRIVNLLSRGEVCVSDLQEILGLAQPFVSRQLTKLRDAGLARADRQGASVRNSLIRSGALRNPLHALSRTVLPRAPMFQSDLESFEKYDNSGRLRSGSLNPRADIADSNMELARPKHDAFVSDAGVAAEVGRPEGEGQ